MTPEEKLTQAAKEYSDKWDARVAKGDQANQIVLTHERNGMPLNPSDYPADLRLDIHAAMLRRDRKRNWAAGRLIDDYGDEDGRPTRERKAPLGTEM